MLYWQANFQIPNSGVQAAEVFAVVNSDNSVAFYADSNLTIHLYTKEYEFPEKTDKYDYLMSLDEFANYTKI